MRIRFRIPYGQQGKIVFCLLVIIFFGFSCGKEKKKPMDNGSVNPSMLKYPLPKNTDSLLVILEKLSEDSNRVNALNAICSGLMFTKLDTALVFGNRALGLAEKLNWQSGIGKSYYYIGECHRLSSNFPQALDYYFKAMTIWDTLEKNPEIKSTILVFKSRTISNIGMVYHQQGDFSKALDYYFRAIKMAEDLGDKKGVETKLGNVGNIYYGQGDFQKALDYYNRALKMAEEINNKKGIAIHLGSIGAAYATQKDFPKALECFFRALKTGEELHHKSLIALTLGNIGNVYQDISKQTKNKVKSDSLLDCALEYYSKALEMDREMGSKLETAIWLGNIGTLYIETNRFKEAYAYLYGAIALADSIGAMDNVKIHYEQLSNLYEKSTVPLLDSVGGKLLDMEGMRLRGLYYFKKHTSLRDTLFSEQNKKQLVKKEMNYEFEKKEAATKAENDKKAALADEQLKQKEMERNYFIAGFALVALLAGFIFRGYRQKQKANEIIFHQKVLVEEKQKEILDSIHYAKRIQKSLLPTGKYIQKSLDRFKVLK